MLSEYWLPILMSFLAGVFGFSTFKFWLIPISRYQKKKKEISDWLHKVSDGDGEKSPAVSKGEVKKAHKKCAQLNAIYDYEIPYWYKLHLNSRNESPQKALEFMFALSKSKEMADQRENLKQVKQVLSL